MAKTDKPLTKDALVSMQVIDSNGHLVGKVKDVAFVVGQLGISLSVENEEGETQCIQWQDIQAASDFILLKPQYKGGNQTVCFAEQTQPVQSTEAKESAESATKKQPLCPTCNQPLTWIPQYGRWYCYNDKKYVNPSESSKNEWKEVFQEQEQSKPTPKKQATQPTCPTFGKPLTWIPQYSRWYCYNDKKYV